MRIDLRGARRSGVNLALLSALAVGAEVDVNSRYLWRGAAWSHDPVLQPSLHASARGFTLTAWGTELLGENAPDHRFTETDLVAEYEKAWGCLAVAPSFTTYLLKDDPDTGELGLTVSCDVPLGTFSLVQAVDLVDAPGAWFGQLSLSRSLTFASGLDLEGTVGTSACSGRFVEYYLAPAGSRLEPAAFMVEPSIGLPISREVSLRLHGTVSRMFNSEMRAAAGDHACLLSGGLTIAIER